MIDRRLADKILEYLGRQDISMTEFARRCGLPVSTISNYARGRMLPKTDQLAKLVSGSGVSADWWLENFYENRTR